MKSFRGTNYYVLLINHMFCSGLEASLGQHQEVAVENHTLDRWIGVAGNVI